MEIDELDDIMNQIEAQRVRNNHYFMKMWRMVFECPHCQTNAREFQKEIRQGDLRISELNSRLAST